MIAFLPLFYLSVMDTNSIAGCLSLILDKGLQCAGIQAVLHPGRPVVGSDRLPAQGHHPLRQISQRGHGEVRPAEKEQDG